MPALFRLIPPLITALALTGCASVAPATAPSAVTIAPPAPPPAPEPKPAAVVAAEPTVTDLIAAAPERSQLACTSEGVLTAGQVPGEMLYRCEGLEQSVTLDELREAGWRLEQMGIGVRAEIDGETGLPLTISVRKLH